MEKRKHESRMLIKCDRVLDCDQTLMTDTDEEQDWSAIWRESILVLSGSTDKERVREGRIGE